jgi:hypothetical protein
MLFTSDYPTSLSAYSEVLSRLGPGRQQGHDWMVRCPAHDDDNPSLALRLGREGRLVVHCHAGCEPQEIVSALGLTLAALFPPREDERRARHARVTARYDYQDEQGAVLYQVQRLEWRDTDGRRRKRFRQCRPDPARLGDWIWELGDVRRVLYRLPTLLAADPRRTVLVVAGEKDCETARQLGLIATTNVCGERAEWLDSYSETLSGRHVTIIPDGDKPGRRHAAKVAGSLLIHDAASVRVAGLPEKDLTDFVEALKHQGVTDTAEVRAAVERALREAPRWHPAVPVAKAA